MGELLGRTAAKLGSSKTFCFGLISLGGAFGGVGAAVAAYEAPPLLVLAIVALTGIMANRFAFATLESDIGFVMSVVVGLVGLPITAGLIAVPGAFAGILVSLAVSSILDRPNVAAAIAAAESREAAREAEPGAH